jgi:hypothetical protein
MHPYCGRPSVFPPSHDPPFSGYSNPLGPKHVVLMGTRSHSLYQRRNRRVLWGRPEALPSREHNPAPASESRPTHYADPRMHGCLVDCLSSFPQVPSSEYGRFITRWPKPRPPLGTHRFFILASLDSRAGEVRLVQVTLGSASCVARWLRPRCS